MKHFPGNNKCFSLINNFFFFIQLKKKLRRTKKNNNNNDINNKPTSNNISISRYWSQSTTAATKTATTATNESFCTIWRLWRNVVLTWTFIQGMLCVCVLYIVLWLLCFMAHHAYCDHLQFIHSKKKIFFLNLFSRIIIVMI